MRTLVNVTLSFGYGAAFHFALVRAYGILGFAPGADSSFVDAPLTAAVLACLGGALVAFFISNLRVALLKKRLTRSAFVIRGGWYFAGATFLALEAFYLISAFYLSARADDFLLWFVGIQTYGLGPLFGGLPFAFASGALAAGVLWQTGKYESAG